MSLKHHSDHHNTYSYLLTLDEFRRDIPDEFKPSWVKLTTITIISKFREESGGERKINIPKLKECFEKVDPIMVGKVGSKGYPWKLKPTKFYNQISLVHNDTFSTKSIKIFPNGSIQVAGCSDIFDCRRIISQLSYVFNLVMGKDCMAPIETFKVVMINSNFSLNYNFAPTCKYFVIRRWQAIKRYHVNIISIFDQYCFAKL